MVFKTLTLALCLVLSLSSATKSQELDVTGNAVELVTSEGLNIEFPYYLPITTMDPDYRDSTIYHVVEMLKYIKEVVGKSLMSERVHRFGWAGVTSSLIMRGNEIKNARKKLKVKTAGSGGKFNTDMKDMFSDMMAESKVIEKTVEPENPLVLKEEIDMVLNGFIEAVKASPVASYFNWPKGKINEESFIKVGAKYMARLSKQGYGTFLNCISALLSLLAKIGSMG